jgi:D-apionolactonase
LLDFVSHCTCPIVHAADDLSVMESLEALPHIVRSTRAIIGKDKAYRIGPSTIGMRHNPYGERVKDNPTNRRVMMTNRDPRQTGLFAAAWMIGYLAATAEARLQTLTVGSLTGPLGLACAGASGELLLHPVFHAARGSADLGTHPRYECHSSRPDCVAAVAGVDREGVPVAWLANLTGRTQKAMVTGDQEIHSILLLDEERFTAPDFEAWHTENVKAIPSVELSPYAVARLRF